MALQLDFHARCDLKRQGTFVQMHDLAKQATRSGDFITFGDGIDISPYAPADLPGRRLALRENTTLPGSIPAHPGTNPA